MIECYLSDEQAMLALGEVIAARLKPGMTIYLHGQLGAGKTTLVRGILQALGHQGRVKSPTFTLVEPYRCHDLSIYHFDLYRLSEPDELEYIGIRDYSGSDAICIIEWPEKGQGLLPPPDINCNINIHLPGRQVKLEAKSRQGEEFLNNFPAV